MKREGGGQGVSVKVSGEKKEDGRRGDTLTCDSPGRACLKAVPRAIAVSCVDDNPVSSDERYDR